MKMKKWWIACILALIALLATGAALADGDVIFRDCPICGVTTQFVRVRYGGNYYINNVPSHVGYYKCSLGHGDELAYLDDNVPHSGGAATCSEQAKCEVCGTHYGALLPHDLVPVEAKAATCTEDGWDAYEACKNCDYSTRKVIEATGHDYETETVKPTCTESGCTAQVCANCGDTIILPNTKIAALGHWFGEWALNGEGVHTATCKRDGEFTYTAECERMAVNLLDENENTVEFSFCPVCGDVNGEMRLQMIEAKAIADELPKGEAIVRMGKTENGETLMSVGFEYAGTLTQPTGAIQITLPTEALRGYVTLALLNADGTETPIRFTVNGETASFTLDFADGETPVQVIHLIPAA